MNLDLNGLCGKELFVLGNSYYLGEGVEQDYTKALECWKRAGESNHVLAISSLADVYFQGEIVEQDLELAVNLYYLASELGDLDAIRFMFNHTRHLNDNHGVFTKEKRFEWARHLAFIGEVSAQVVLSNMYLNGEGTSRCNISAYAWILIAVSLDENLRRFLNELLKCLRLEEIEAGDRLARELKKEIAI